KATVRVVNESTGISRSVVTEDDGTYRVSNLPVGKYTIVIEKEGFRETKLEGVVLQVDQIAEINPKLQAGNLKEEVSITAAGPIVDITSPSLGQVINNQQIVDLPLNGRQFLQLAQLSPGVTVDPEGSLGQNLGGVNGPRITSNGGREDQNNFTLDGVRINDPFY